MNYYRAAAYEDPPNWQADAERQLPIPMLFLWGSRRAGTSEASGSGPLEEWGKFFPNAQGKLPGNDWHFLQTEAPKLVNREIVSFFTQGT